jgi:receptor protein-tyrosine kinase
MSRVYEALKKAGDAKKQADVRDVIPSAGNGRTNGSSTAESIVPIADIGHPLQDVWPVTNGDPKSWRQWLEEMVFGWDLRRYKRYPIVSLDKESAAAEQYKILREQLKHLRNGSRIQTVALTSAVKQDGKTMVSVNLAAAIALGFEAQVLLIDGDMRNPDVHHYFGLQRSPGLSDYLTASAAGKITDYVQETFLPGLRVLPAGKPLDLTSELLTKERLKTLMAEIRDAFPDHQILVDTPPVLSTADPLILCREVEAVIFVVRAGQTPRNNLLKAIQDLNTDKIVGIVLNGAELGTLSKYYHYYSSSHA